MTVRFPVRGTLATLAAGALTLGLALPAAAAEPGSESLDYVALGDSYSAGSGILPLDPSAPPLCLRTTANYPNVVADRTGADLTDVTCGAAQTKHFSEPQYPGVAPQLDALSEDTDLVTLTIGGNDNNTFIGAILACGAAGLASGGQGSPCKDANGSKYTDDINNKTYPAVRSAVAAIKEKAPNARVAVLGYPWIMPPEAVPGCFLKMPVAEGDVPYLRDIQTALNAAVRKATEENGATFVDLAAASEGHDACQPMGTRWIEPVLFGTDFVPVHPNALGESKMAERALEDLDLG